MGLTLSLSNALSGLQAAQNNLALISANIANAQTPGYSRQILGSTTQIIEGEGGGGVNTGVAERVTDPILIANLRSQAATTSAASTLDSYYQRIQDLFGNVGAANSLSDTLNKFTSAAQTLAASSDDPVAQQNLVSAGQQLSAQLNSMSAGIQTLRTNADTDIGNAVNQVNTLIQNIANYNSEIAHARAFNQSTATLEDQRDLAVQQLAQQMNISTFTRSDDSMVVMTGGGKTLVDGIAETINFTPSGTVIAGSPVSKLTINGLDITSDITGGNIGALLQMRDTQLPNLTAELNQFTNQLFNAGQVATAQNQTMSGTPAVGDVLSGNIEGVAFTTAPLGATTTAAIAAAIQAQFANFPNIQVTATGPNTIQIVDAAGHPLTSAIALASGTGTESFLASPPANPTVPFTPMSTQSHTMSGTPAVGDVLTGTVDGINYTTAAIGAATTTAIAAAIQAQLGALPSVRVTATSATTIQFTDISGAPLSSTITFKTGTGTESFVAGTPTQPLPSTNSGLSGPTVSDANHFFAAVNTATGLDNAGTIQVNPSIVKNPSLLNGAGGVSTPAIANALANSFEFSTPVFAATGNFNSAQTLTLGQYAGQILGQNSTAAAAAHDNAQFQTGVQNEISTRAQSVSGVNMDQELANLQIYQTAYSASARVVQAVNSMFNSLLQIQT
jgi:flagellar hook-associated protein 1 FlgK